MIRFLISNFFRGCAFLLSLLRSVFSVHAKSLAVKIPIMFQQVRQDLEAQSSPGSTRDGGHLRSRVPRYQKDLKALEGNKHLDLSEGLFWYQDFGSPHSTTSFGFAEDTTFGESLINLGRALKDARKASMPTLQLW